MPTGSAHPAASRSAGALMAAATPAVLSDVSAARHWGLPLPAWAMDVEAKISTAVPAGAGRQQRRGVRGRRLLLPEEHLTLHDGLQVTTADRTWIDCAAVISRPHLVAMGDAILARGLATEDDLRQMVRWGRGRRGIVSARHCLSILDPATGSPAESRVRAILILAGLPRPECNIEVFDHTGWLARPDLVWKDALVIVEYDGRTHEDESQRRKDALRRNLLQEAGWQVIVFTADDLHRPERMVRIVSGALRSRSAPTPREW